MALLTIFLIRLPLGYLLLVSPIATLSQSATHCLVIMRFRLLAISLLSLDVFLITQPAFLSAHSSTMPQLPQSQTSLIFTEEGSVDYSKCLAQFCKALRFLRTFTKWISFVGLVMETSRVPQRLIY